MSELDRQLILSKKFAALQEKRKLLQAELVKLIADRDELLSVVKPHLEARYYALVGKEQYRLFALRNEVLRTRRKIELFRVAVNRGEMPDPELIESRLDEELKQWVEKLEELKGKIEWAGYYSRLPRLTAAEAIKLKKLYRKLVRKLHPDFNEEQPASFKHLWERVNVAYQNSDLEELQTLLLLLSDHKEDLAAPSTMEQLAADTEKLRDKIDQLLKNLAEVNEHFPFKYREKLADESWVASQVKAVKNQIEEMERRRLHYASLLKELDEGKDQIIH